MNFGILIRHHAIFLIYTHCCCLWRFAIYSCLRVLSRLLPCTFRRLLFAAVFCPSSVHLTPSDFIFLKGEALLARILKNLELSVKCLIINILIENKSPFEAFVNVKGGLLRCKRPPFTMRNTVFCAAKHYLLRPENGIFGGGKGCNLKLMLNIPP